MTEFKVGDRVRYTGAKSLRDDGEHLSPTWVDKEGVVVEVRGKSLGVDLEGFGRVDPFAGNVELIDQTTELAELRAWKAEALANGYNPPEPETDEDAIKRIYADWCAVRIENGEDAIAAAIAWARANPR